MVNFVKLMDDTWELGADDADVVDLGDDCFNNDKGSFQSHTVTCPTCMGYFSRYCCYFEIETLYLGDGLSWKIGKMKRHIHLTYVLHVLEM